MNICKNVECGVEIRKDRVYCSLKCRNYYVNKYIRNYNLNGKGLKEKAISNYIPKKCKNSDCNNLISYHNRENLYCSKECASIGISLGNVNRKGIKFNVTEELRVKYQNLAFKNLKKTTEELHKKSIESYHLNPKTCKQCNAKIEYKKRAHIFCSLDCKNLYNRKDMTDFAKYKQDTIFKFNLADYPNEFNFKLIEQHGWYKPRNRGNNLGGISRDHMLSVRDGFNKGINPKLLAHPANCRLMIHNENISKNKKSVLTEEELLNRIKEWDKKYNGG